MAGTGKEEVKKRKADMEPISERESMSVEPASQDTQDGSETGRAIPSSAARTSSDMTMILHMLGRAEKASAAKDLSDREWQFNADKSAFDN